MDGQVDVCMDGQMDVWMEGWMEYVKERGQEQCCCGFTGGHRLQGSEVGNKAIAHSLGDVCVCVCVYACM